MENFITGYPGHEHQVRRELLKVLGKDKYEFFFDKVGVSAPHPTPSLRCKLAFPLF